MYAGYPQHEHQGDPQYQEQNGRCLQLLPEVETIAAITVDRIAILRLSTSEKFRVNAINTGIVPIGSTTVKKNTKVETKSFIQSLPGQVQSSDGKSGRPSARNNMVRKQE